jgi:hypothetical protein
MLSTGELQQKVLLSEIKIAMQHEGLFVALLAVVQSAATNQKSMVIQRAPVLNRCSLKRRII